MKIIKSHAYLGFQIIYQSEIRYFEVSQWETDLSEMSHNVRRRRKASSKPFYIREYHFSVVHEIGEVLN